MNSVAKEAYQNLGENELDENKWEMQCRNTANEEDSKQFFERS